jgi:hypothetical protein
MLHDHNWIFVTVIDHEGTGIRLTAPSLGWMEETFLDRGLSKRFDDYLSFEQTVWDELERQLDHITEDKQSYQDDEHYPADYYLELAKVKAENETKKLVRQFRLAELKELGIDPEAEWAEEWNDHAVPAL